MKRITEHLGEIIIALVILVALLALVIALRSPTDDFFKGVGKEVVEQRDPSEPPDVTLGDPEPETTAPPITYEVHYNANGGFGTMANSTHTYGEIKALNANAFTKTGYRFRGWATSPTGSVVYADKATVKNLTTVDGDVVELYAVWRPNEYKVAFDPNKGTGDMDDFLMTYDKEDTLPENTFKRRGYKFIGWNTKPDGSGDSYADEKTVKNLTDQHGVTVTLYAQWELIIYDITYVPDGGMMPEDYPDEYTVEDDPKPLPKPEKPGYDFDGWYEVPNPGPDEDPVKETPVDDPDPTDKIYYAQWEPIVYSLNYTLNGGALASGKTNPSSFTIETPTFTLNNPSKTGYIFNGWTEKISTSKWYEGFVNFDTGKVEESTTYPNSVYSELIYLESGVTYTISGTNLGGVRWRFYDTNKNYLGNTSSSTFTPTKNGYVRVLLYEGCTAANRNAAVIQSSQGTTVPIVKGSTGNRAYIANWTPITYTIKYNANGGSGTMADSSHTYDNAKSLTANAFTKTGYTFAGWATSASGDVVYADKASVKNLTTTNGATVNLYAKWTPNTYTVKYNANGGSGTMADSSHTYDTAKNLTANAFTKTGYTFAGWATSASGDVVYADKASVKNLTATNGGTVNLYAKWTPITYYVKYNANGGSGTMADSSHTYDTAKNLTANAFTKTGYTFAGWATSASGDVVYADKASVKNLTATNGGTVNLYAKWTPITYYVTYNANGGSGSMSNSTHTYDTAKNLTANAFTRSGYTFKGWATSASGSVVYADQASVKNLSSTSGATVNLYAVWQTSSHTVYFADNINQIYNLNNISTTTSDRMSYSVSDGKVTVTANNSDGYGFINARVSLTAGQQYVFTAHHSGTWGTDVEAFLMLDGGYSHYYYMGSDEYVFTPTQSGTYYIRLDVNTSGATHTFYNMSISKVVKTTTVSPGSTYGTFASVSRTGYTHVGWYNNSKASRDSSIAYRNRPWIYYADAYGDLYNAFGYNETSLKNHYTNNGNSEGRRKSQYLTTDTVTATKDEVLYAGWNPNVIKLTLNGNGGSGHTSTVYYEYGINKFYTDAALTNQITAITRPTRTGYTYNTSKGFTGDGTSGGTNGERYIAYDSVEFASDLCTDIYKDATLYANWSVATYTNTVNHILFGGSPYAETTFATTTFTAQYGSTWTFNSSIATTAPNGTTLSHFGTSSFSSDGSWVTYNIGDTMTQPAGNRTFNCYYKPIDYTITYNMNGGTNSSSNPGTYNVLNGVSFANPSRSNYNFTGWTNSSGSTISGINPGATPVTDGSKVYSTLASRTTGNQTVNANWSVISGVAYKVQHWQQNVNSSNYTLVATDNFTGTAGASVTPAVKSYTGFNSPSTQTVTIASDGSTVVNYYYTRKSYTVTLNYDAGISAVSGAGTYQYGASVTINATVKSGFTWNCWTGTHSTTTKQYTFTMPAGNVTDRANTIIAQAIYSATDHSLTYIRDRLYTAGETYNGKAVTNVYTGFESASYTAGTAPWYGRSGDVTSVYFEDQMNPVSTAAWFYQFTNCSSFNVANLNMAGVSNANYMFGYAGESVTSTFTISGMNNWNVSGVSDMSFMFFRTGYDASSFSIGDLSGWKTSNLTTTRNMFAHAGYSASSFDIGDLDDWDLYDVTDTFGMFNSAGFNATSWTVGDLSGWDMDNVTMAAWMFSDAGRTATTFNLGNLDDWDVGNITSMYRMFGWSGNIATSYNIGDLSGWDVSSCTTMYKMFVEAGTKATTFDIGNIGKWGNKTANVTDMNGMFNGTGDGSTTFYIGDLSGWSTGNVTDMSEMFLRAGRSATNSTFKMDLSGWNVSAVTNYVSFISYGETRITPPNF